MTYKSSDLRILFVGAVHFSEHCLREVLGAGGNVVSVFTLPPERARRHSDYADLGETAREHGIPAVYLGERITKPANVEAIRDLMPDVILILGWSELVSAEILSIPTIGCIGSHPALLPRNRGRHPLIWALVQGWTESGLTFFFVDEGTDSGDILWQKPFPITEEDDAASLYRKVEELAAEGIAEFLPQLADGTYVRLPQDHSKATYLRKRTRDDGEIDWTMPPTAIRNLVRGLTKPYPGAHTYLGDAVIRVWGSRLLLEGLAEQSERCRPGEVLRVDEEGLVVATGGSDALLITEYEPVESTAVASGDILGRSS